MSLAKLKKGIKEGLHSSSWFVRNLSKCIYVSFRIIRNIWKFLSQKQYRSIIWMRLFRGKDVQQTTQLTWMDRYPDIFSACKELYGDKKDLKILSFGCCTGEEVVTLRQYFPDAFIVGAEINKNSLKICKNRKLDNKIVFIESKDELIKKYGPFDMVFCMAVMQRTPHMVADQKLQDLKKIYPFEKYERQVRQLDEYVNAEGMLIIHHAQYRFTDVDVSNKYEVYGELGHCSSIFSKESKIIQHGLFIPSMYRKKCL